MNSKLMNNNVKTMSVEDLQAFAKQMKAERNAKVVVASTEEMGENSKERALDKVYDGSVSLEVLINITEPVIDMTLCKTPIRVLQKIYSAGSAVGQVTTMGQNIFMLDVEDNNGFSTFKDGLRLLKNQDNHVPYKTVWVEGYNKMTFKFEDGHYYNYYVVTVDEMRLLEERITSMDKRRMTKEDAKALQADLPPFIRAWQESSIDVSKDKDKVFLYGDTNYDMFRFFESTKTLSQQTKKFMKQIDFSFDAIKGAKKAKRQLPRFKYTNVEVELRNPCVDLNGHATKALQEAAEDYLNSTPLDLFKAADNSMYEPFLNDCKASKEAKELAYFIREKIYRVCYDAKHNEDVKVTNEQYALLRNIIYTKAASLGIEGLDVARIAISAKMSKIRKDDKTNEIYITNSNVDSFGDYPVKNIFKEECKQLLSNQPRYESFNPVDIVEYMNRNIEDYEVISFVDGVSEDGQIKLYEAYTGCLTELNGNLIQMIDVCAYEPTRAFISIDAYAKDTSVQQIKAQDETILDKGEFLSSVVENLDVVQAVGQKDCYLIGEVDNKAQMLCKVDANFKYEVKATYEVCDSLCFKTTSDRARITVIAVK
jgi:hypothetical protein